MSTTTSRQTALTLDELVGRIERLPLSRMHKRVVALTAGGYLFDAYDIGLLSFIMPALAADLKLTSVQIGLVFTTTFVGMFFGTLLGGTLADYFGRLRVFKYTLIVFSFATAATGFVHSLEALLVLRFITGVGLGGEQPVSFTYVSEMVPSEYRGRLTGLAEAMWGFGMMLAGGVSLLLVPKFGWQAAFFAGILPAGLIWFFRLGIPESPRWFMIKNRPTEAEAQLRRMEDEVEKELGTKLPQPEKLKRIVVPQKSASYRTLFSPVYRRRTVMFGLVWFFAMFGFWGVNTWLPTLLKQNGYSLYASIGYFFLMNTMSVPGCLLGAYLCDKIGRKQPIVFYWLFAAVTTVLYAWALWAHLPVAIMLAFGIVAIFLMLGGFAVLYAYTPESYPTEIRGSGSGLANSLGRVGAMASPALVGFLYPIAGLFVTIGVIASGFVIAAIMVAILGVETRRKPLESIPADFVPEIQADPTAELEVRVKA
jgi:putative MFS transporter